MGKGEKGILQKLTKETKGHREGETTTRMIAFLILAVRIRSGAAFGFHPLRARPDNRKLKLNRGFKPQRHGEDGDPAERDHGWRGFLGEFYRRERRGEWERLNYKV